MEQVIEVRAIMDEGTAVRTRLRVATRPLHTELNHHPLLSSLTQPNPSKQNYPLLLTAYYHLYQTIERQIKDYLDIHPDVFDYSSRYKTGWLARDLASFHIDPLTQKNAPPRAVIAPKIQNIGQLIGVLYTIEGSTLGGQIIARNLAKYQDISARDGLAFFCAYGSNTIAMWQELTQFIENIADDEPLCLDAEHAASQTFVLFKHVLDDYQHAQLHRPGC